MTYSNCYSGSYDSSCYTPCAPKCYTPCYDPCKPSGYTCTTVCKGPDAINDSFTVTENEGIDGVDFNILANDIGVSGQTLTVTAIDGQASRVGAWYDLAQGGKVLVGANGDVDFSADGDFEYLAAGETRIVTFTYSIASTGTTSCTTYVPGGYCWGEKYAGCGYKSYYYKSGYYTTTTTTVNGGCDTATVCIVVTGVNDLTDGSETSTVAEDAGNTALINVLANTYDPEAGDPVVVGVGTGTGVSGANVGTVVIGSNGGQFVINANGTASFNTNGAFDYLNPGQTATTSVTYQVKDAAGAIVTSTYTVTVTGKVGAVCAVDAVDDAYSVRETEDVLANLLVNDTFNGSVATAGQLTVTAVNVPGLGNVAVGTSFTVTTEGGRTGTVRVNADGTFSFDGGDNFVDLVTGQTDSFTLTYTVSGICPPPPGTKICVEAEKMQLCNYSVECHGSGSGGYWVKGKANCWSSASTCFTGQTGKYNLDVKCIDENDGRGQMKIFVNGVCVSGVINLDQDNCGDGISNIKFRTISLCNLNLKCGDKVEIQACSNRGEWARIDCVTFTSCPDGTTVTDTATVRVTVNGEGQVNLVPVAVADLIATDEDTAAAPINVLANDTQGDGPATVVAVQGGTLGQPITLTTTEDGQTLTATATLSADGTLTLVPGPAFDLLDAGESRSFSLTYTIRDANGDESTATITLRIDGLNEGPDAKDNAYTVINAATRSGNLITDDTGSGVDSDPNGDALTVIAVQGGAVNTGFVVTTEGGRTGTLTVNLDGSFSFVPLTGFDDLYTGITDKVTFTYTVRDPSGATDTASVTLNILGQGNKLPVAVNDLIVTAENIAATPINVLDNDTAGDGGSVQGKEIVAVQGGTLGQPITLTTTEDGQTLTATATLNADGTLTLVPGAGFDLLDANESRSFSLTYTIEDANGDQATATIDLRIDGLNEGPDAKDNGYVTAEDAAVSGNILTDDTGAGVDSDPNGDGLTVTGIEGGTVGTAFSITTDGGRSGTLLVGSDGTFTFTPVSGFETLDTGETDTLSLDYTISDPSGASDTATVTLEIEGKDSAVPKTINVSLVVDLSSSFTGQNSFLEVDDLNGDGSANTSFDIAFAGIEKLVADLIAGNTSGDTLNISLIGFGNTAETPFVVDSVDDVQAWSDFLVGNSKLGQSGSNFTNGLLAAKSWFTDTVSATEDDTNVVYFLSDGQPTINSGQPEPSVIADEIKGAGIGGNIQAIYVGSPDGADDLALAALDALDSDTGPEPAAVAFDDDGANGITPTILDVMRAQDVFDLV